MIIGVVSVSYKADTSIHKNKLINSVMSSESSILLCCEALQEEEEHIPCYTLFLNYCKKKLLWYWLDI